MIGCLLTTLCPPPDPDLPLPLPCSPFLGGLVGMQGEWGWEERQRCLSEGGWCGRCVLRVLQSKGRVLMGACLGC